MPKQKIWLITGVSSGFGRSLVEQVVATGDKVIGTLRKPEQIAAFNKEFAGKATAIGMDVNQSKEITQGFDEALKIHGRIDVLVNNAGYGLFSSVEEASEEEVRAQMETNFFGALSLTQAVLPVMRARKFGHIVQISSIAGFASMPGLGIYNASKYALEGFSEALSAEVAPLGIKVLIVEPGPFRTKWAGDSAIRAKKQLPDYEATAHAVYKMISGYNGNQPGDPDKAAKLIIKMVNADNAPLRLPLGQMAIERMRGKLTLVQKDVDSVEKESLATAYGT